MSAAIFLRLGDTSSTPRNVPEAQHIEDVEKAVGKADVNALRMKGQELLTKYRCMELDVESQLRQEEARGAEFEDVCAALEFLKKSNIKAEKDEDGEPLPSEELSLDFLLAPGIYAKAKVPPTNRVCLWLGGDVMMEYPLDEAEVLVTKNRDGHQHRIEQLTKEVEWIRRQRIVTEVNVARIHNLGVMRRREGGGGLAAASKA